ncbi:MAG: hypothetical protein L3J59_04410 [Methylococcaceae bacterium]|nr:hypothetical protein [Methylococcaceae bacterium]
MKTRFIYFSIAVSLATVSGCQQQNGESSTPATNQMSSSPNQMAYIDPETGELTSKPANSAGLENNHPSLTTNIDLPKLEEVSHPDGTVTTKLNGRYRSHLVATIGCNGKMKMEHKNKPELGASKCVESQEGKK